MVNKKPRTKEWKEYMSTLRKGKNMEEIFGVVKAGLIKEKMRNAKLIKPTNYWLGKKRPNMSGDNKDIL